MNSYDGQGRFRVDDLREFFGVDPSVPMIECNAGVIASARQTVATLVDHVIRRGDGSAHAIAAG